MLLSGNLRDTSAFCRALTWVEVVVEFDVTLLEPGCFRFLDGAGVGVCEAGTDVWDFGATVSCATEFEDAASLLIAAKPLRGTEESREIGSASWLFVFGL